jgi:hypothetical protein
MPSILFVDDHPDDVSRFVESLAGRAECKALHPQDLTIEDLAAASLVLIDSRLEDWPERDALSGISLKPLDGKALAAVLRAHADTAKGTGITAFAILTAHLEDYSETILPDNQEHAMARSNNLEWFFRKTSDLQTLTNQFLILAGAVTLLPEKWPLSDSEESQRLMVKLLALKDERNWFSRALLDVDKCNPPIRELSEWSHGVELLRWVLHRILPYPCFLWDRVRTAARLRMTVASLDRVLSSESDLARALSECEYTGIASQFLGRRWWRAGLESKIWELTDGKPFDIGVLKSTLAARSTIAIEWSAQEDPIICLDEHYRTLEEFHDISSAVRLMLDDWPSYADAPWTPVAVAKEHPEVLAAVVEQDREKVEDDTEEGRG